ncbi:glycosyltransferase family 1 protein, partial [Salmonella enterica]|nr:glycosyltransferase family 1 protein [Salmonella enterica]
LRQFIEQASINKNNFIIFVPSTLALPNYENITYVKTAPKGWLKRIYWDWIGCKKFIKRESLRVKKVICLQNSSMNVPYPQIIYLHQPIPFSNIDFFFKEFNLNNFKLLLYKKFYAIFIFKFINKQSIFVVQTEWMKSSLLNRCRNLNVKQVVVLRPDIKLFEARLDNKEISKNTLLYPATALSYKNHLVILKSLTLLKKQFGINDIKFQVTFDKGQYKVFDRYVYENDLSTNIEYLGVISYIELQKKYLSASLVVFPSYIESYGLPLIEAAILGKRIICSDLPYARDVLNNYEGGIFVKYNDENNWANVIYDVLTNKSCTQIRPYENDNCSSWPRFFDLI